jgi:hypothetical protein
MCTTCRWFQLSLRIDAYLESQRAMILDNLREVIVANQHATPEQIDAIETVLESEASA